MPEGIQLPSTTKPWREELRDANAEGVLWSQGCEVGRPPASERLARDLLNSKLEDRVSRQSSEISDGILGIAPRLVDPIEGLKQSSYSQCFLHIEPLLDQAADFFDRFLKEDQLCQELKLKNYALWNEFFEFNRLEAIHEMEIKNGFYELPAELSRLNAESEEYNRRSAQAVSDRVGAKLDSYFNETAIRERMALQRLSAFVNCFPTFMGHCPDSRMDSSQTRFTASNGAETTKPDVFVAMASRMAGDATSNEKSDAEAQYQSSLNAQQAAVRRKSAAEKKLAWDMLDANFRRLRTEVAKDMLNEKFKLAQQKRSFLDFQRQINDSEGRCFSDASNASLRASAARKGMETIFGTNLDFPDSVTEPVDWIFAHLAWVRAAIEWRLRESRFEQLYAQTISLRSVIGGTAWTGGLKEGVLRFELPSYVLDGQCLARLRGVSVTVDSPDKKDLWHLGVKVPEKSYFVRKDGTKGEVDQSTLPMVRIGRVATRVQSKDLEVAGASSLFNASPIGEWTVNIGQRSNYGSDREQIEDICLDLYLVTVNTV